MAMPSTWDKLPEIVLAQVLQHLNEGDRYRASLVSKPWSRAFRSPQLWRKMKTGNIRFFSAKHFKFINSLGQYIKELDIDCSALRYPASSENILQFLLALNQKPIRLQKYSLQLPLSVWKEDCTRHRVVKLICKFLGRQSNLTYFNMNFCKASPEEGISFLSQLAKTSSRSLKILLLYDFFIHGCNLLSSPDYQNVMSSFESLVELVIYHNYIDSDVLKQIVKNCSRSLKYIKIYYMEVRQIDHFIPNTTWSWVRKTCPQLYVDIDIDDSYEVSDYTHTIPSEMKLLRFTMCTPNSIEGRFVDIGLNSLVIQLCQFRKTLVLVELRGFDENFIFDDSLLIDLVSSCPKLRSFYFGGSCSSQTVKTLCEMQKNGDIHFRECYFHIYEGNAETVDSLKEIKEFYRSVFDKQGVKFVIDYQDVLNFLELI